MLHDVQLFWKLLLAVWKATDNSVFCKLTPHPHSSNQEEYCNHIDSNRFTECHFEIKFKIIILIIK